MGDSNRRGGIRERSSCSRTTPRRFANVPIDSASSNRSSDAGAVALLHPWLAHCGTTNLSDAPRLMANGMVRVTPEAFARDGGVRVLAGLADVPGKRRRADKDGEDDGATHAKATTPNAEAPEHESPRLTREALTARATALAESAAHPARSAVPDASLPKVSIVIPVHNARPWLDECFASVCPRRTGVRWK